MNIVIDKSSTKKLNEYNKNIFDYVKNNYSLVRTLYLDLGVKIVRLLCFSEEFIPHINKQLGYVIKEASDKYDATIVLWKEDDVNNWYYKKIIPTFNPKNNLYNRVEMIASKYIAIYDKQFSKSKPILEINAKNNIILTSYDIQNNTYFYGVKSLDSEELVKSGHLFVQVLNNILKTPNTNLVHGASFGLNNNGVLLCARGQKGKSTLAVLSMLSGFEYVSDDYLILEKDKKNLYAHPIYSIITLSPQIYNKIFDELEGTRFISNNYRKDKYVINISKYHNDFRKKYPIKICMFPEITSCKEPSIKKCTSEEKGRAIVQLVHSTIFQMHDTYDIKTITKLINMVKNFVFYKINLCNNIYKNVEYLKRFLKENKMPAYAENEIKMFTDITDGIAVVINSETGIYYGMNGFGTQIYENLLKGVSTEKIWEKLKSFGKGKVKKKNLKAFVDELIKYEIIIKGKETDAEAMLDETVAKKDKFLPKIKEYTDAQELLLADPIHEVKEETGWNPEKSSLNKDKKDVKRRESKLRK